MFDIICLWCGRIIIFTIAAILASVCLFLIIKGVSILLRKPYYCIKRLLPWKWATENEIKGIQNTFDNLYKDDISSLPKWKRNVKIIRKGRFGNLYIPNKLNWWDAKNHFFFIKKG